MAFPQAVGAQRADDGGKHGGPKRDDDAVPRAFEDLRIAKDGLVPGEREVLPFGEARGVEAEDGQGEQGQVEKGEERDGVEPEPALHARGSLSRRRKSTRTRVTSAMRAMETAAPKGQSRAVVN